MSINNNEYIIKITPNTSRFINEINVYNELNEASTKNNILSNKIIKIYNSDTLKTLIQIKFNLNKNIDDNKNSIIITKKK